MKAAGKICVIILKLSAITHGGLLCLPYTHLYTLIIDHNSVFWLFVGDASLPPFQLSCEEMFHILFLKHNTVQKWFVSFQSLKNETT